MSAPRKTAPLSPRFFTQGRSDAWTARRRRCHNPHWDGPLHPMQDEPSRAWTLISTAVWIIAVIYAASLWIKP